MPRPSFPVSELPAKIQQDVHGRRRKLEGAARRIELEDCELLSMFQYNCEVKHPVTQDSPIKCYPVERLFRR